MREKRIERKTEGRIHAGASDPQRLRRAVATLDEWAGEAFKEGNAEAAEAFGLSLHLIKERLESIANAKGGR